MKEETVYVCEACGCKYDTEKNALECESRHKLVTDVVEYDFLVLERTPERIKLKFDDISCWYRREE